MRFATLLLVLVLGIAAGYGLAPRATVQVAKYELARSEPAREAISGRAPDCQTADRLEAEAIETAVRAIEIASEAIDRRKQHMGFLPLGAAKLLASGLYHRVSATRTVRVCIPVEAYRRVSEAARRAPTLFGGRPSEWTMDLVARLPDPPERLVKAIAMSAFSEHPQEGELHRRRDLRPKARATLASLGDKARPYGERAFELISADDALGTGAAQIAVAAGHPEALSRVAKLMGERLATLPEDKPISWHDRNRLYELAYALALGRERARAHAAPVKALMRWKVQSWAPPFGMVQLDPTQMCLVLEAIEGADAPSLRGFSYCSDPSQVREQ